MTGPPQLDHLVLATRDLEKTVGWVAATLGVRPAAGGQHVGIGTRNFLLSLGPGRYLELIGPDPEQPDPIEPRPFAIDVIDRPTLTAWVARSSRLEEAAGAAARLGFDLGPIRDMSRKTPTGELLRWRLARRRTAETMVVPVLIDWGDTPHPSSTAPAGASLLEFAAVHPRPSEVRKVLAALGLELEVAEGAQPGLEARITGPAGVLELS